MARPSKRSPERRELVLRSLRLGVTRRAAAEYAEIDPASLRRWMAADPGFRDEVIRAEAEAEVRFQSIVADDALGRPAQVDDQGQVVRAEVKPNPASAKWWLSRRRRSDYAVRISVDIEGMVRRMAEADGLDPSDVMAEVNAILGERS